MPKPGSRRDNFSQKVLVILYKRAGGKCCRCAAPTFGPVSNNPSKTVNIGQGAHIAAAAAGGPRYDDKMTPDERASAGNGMWLCSNCHDIIDRDEEEFTTARLKHMKKVAEARAKSQMGVGTLKSTKDSTDGLSVGVSASTIVEIRKSKAEMLALNDECLVRKEAEELLANISFINPQVDSYLPDVGRELVAFFDQLAAHCDESAILLEVIRWLKIIADSYNDSWEREDVEAITGVSKRVLSSAWPRKRSTLYRSGVALLKDLSTYKSLKERSLAEIPLACLRDLKGGVGDMTDGDEPPQAKRLCVDSADDDDTYLTLMEQISVCENAQEVADMEEKLLSLGYEPDVV